MFKLTVRGETIAELKANLADVLASLGGPVAVSGPSIAEVVAAANAEPETPRTRRSRKASEPEVVEPTPPVAPGPTDAEVIEPEAEGPSPDTSATGFAEPANKTLDVEAMLAAEVAPEAAPEPVAEPVDPWAAFIADFSEAVNSRIIPADAALLIARALGVASIASVKSDTAKMEQAREALAKLIAAASQKA